MIEEAIQMLEDLREDPLTPKSIKETASRIINILKEDSPLDLRIKKSLDLLEEVGDDPNLSIYARTQLWNLVTLLGGHK